MATSPPPGPRRTALVTGGGGGVGRAVAARLVEDGWEVGLLGRDAARLDAAVAELGAHAVAIPGDVTKRDDVQAATAELAARGAAPRLLVHAAGLARSSAVLPPDDALWDATMGVNATGAWISATACLPAMLAEGDGDLVFIASTAALRGYRYTAAYVASKHAVLGLARALAADVGPKGVRVHVICPGFLDTPMTDQTVARIVATSRLDAAAARASLAAMNRSGRLIRPEEVAELVLTRLREGTDDPEPVVLE